MTTTVADRLLERLRAWDVTDVFAYPGDGINGILAAFGRADNEPRIDDGGYWEMEAIIERRPRQSALDRHAGERHQQCAAKHEGEARVPVAACDIEKADHPRGIDHAG